MRSEKTKKGKDWKNQLIVWELNDDGQPDDPHHMTKKSSLSRCSFDLKKIHLRRIIYFRSDMPEEQAQLEWTSLLTGAGGVVLGIGSAIVWHHLGAHGRAIEGWKRALCATGMIGGAGAATGGAVAGLCAENIMFHGYLVIECSDGVWLSLEKVDDGVVVRMGRNRFAVSEQKQGEGRSGNDHDDAVFIDSSALI